FYILKIDAECFRDMALTRQFVSRFMVDAREAGSIRGLSVMMQDPFDYTSCGRIENFTGNLSLQFSTRTATVDSYAESFQPVHVFFFSERLRRRDLGDQFQFGEIGLRALRKPDGLGFANVCLREKNATVEIAITHVIGVHDGE